MHKFDCYSEIFCTTKSFKQVLDKVWIQELQRRYSVKFDDERIASSSNNKNMRQFGVAHEI